MKKISLLIFLISFLGIFNSCQKSVDTSAADISALKASVSALQKTTDSLSKALAATNSNVSTLSSKVDSIMLQIVIIQTQISVLNSQLTITNTNITIINTQIVILNQQYTILLAQLNAILAQLSVTPTSLSTGLFAYYPFTGNANDSSGYDNNGTVYGATLTNDRFGNSNSAYNFSSKNYSAGALSNGIYIPYQPYFNVTNISISVWVNPSAYHWAGCSGPCQAEIINRDQYGYSNPNGESWGIYLFSNAFNITQGLYGGFKGPNTGSWVYGMSTTNSVFINNWHNIIVTYNQNLINVYLDGSLFNSQADNVAMNILGNSGISIGVSNQANGYWDPFDGTIDDVRLYNRILNQTEITYLAKH